MRRLSSRFRSCGRLTCFAGSLLGIVGRLPGIGDVLFELRVFLDDQVAFVIFEIVILGCATRRHELLLHAGLHA